MVDGERTPLKETTLSLRFPAAATGGAWNTGGDRALEAKLKDRERAGIFTRATASDEAPVLVKPYYAKDSDKPAGDNVNGYWKSVLEYRTRPPWLVSLLTCNCCFNYNYTITRAQLIWLLNLLCLAVHTTFATFVFLEGGKNPEGMKVRIWRLAVNWTDTSASGYTAALVDNDQPIRLDWLTGAFFTLSAVAHLFVVLLGPFDRYIYIYWRQLDLCFLWWYALCPSRRATCSVCFCTPTALSSAAGGGSNTRSRARSWRWGSPSSAACVSRTRYAPLHRSHSSSRPSHSFPAPTHLRATWQLASIFMLMFGCMICGLLTELWSRPVYVGNGEFDMNRWVGDPDAVSDGSGEIDYLRKMDNRRKRFRNYVRRMVPFVLGTFLYVAAWWIVVNHFLTSLNDLKTIQPDIYDMVPSWVTLAIGGTILIFTLFTFPIMYYQWLPPKFYWRTEIWYCVLSATAKVFLGGLLYINVVLVGSFEEAITYLNVTALDVPLANLTAIV